MPNPQVQFYVARDDGETTGPFATTDLALHWVVDELGMDPDAVENGQPETYYNQARQLVDWYKSLVERHITYSNVEYGMWLKAARELAADVDFVIFGFSVEVEPTSLGIHGLAHLIDPRQIHEPTH